MTSSATDFITSAPTQGNLDVRWIHGSRRRKDRTEPDFQVHAYDRHTYILRQSKLASAEAPFLYLLFGNDRALLLDTGAGKQSESRPLREVIDGLIDSWLAEHPRDGYELVIAHTHGHNDHVAGDGQFADRPDTTVIGRELGDVQEFFGFTNWPDQTVRFDLGGRQLEIIGAPGHHRAAIAVHDPWSGFLISGDTVLPGRIYAFDMPVFLETMDRLVQFAVSHNVTHVMGCHIEMTRKPGRDYALGATYQPDEPPLQMTVEQLTAVRDAARSTAGKPGRHAFDDFLIYGGPFKGYIVPLMLRGLFAKIVPALRG
jgi:glyoxylase-like metal-dependent hydrolase (beta-lactamase superfamily II)